MKSLSAKFAVLALVALSFALADPAGAARVATDRELKAMTKALDSSKLLVHQMRGRMAATDGRVSTKSPWAVALARPKPGLDPLSLQAGPVLFQRVSGQWRPLAAGVGDDCDVGVPRAVDRELDLRNSIGMPCSPPTQRLQQCGYAKSLNINAPRLWGERMRCDTANARAALWFNTLGRRGCTYRHCTVEVAPVIRFQCRASNERLIGGEGDRAYDVRCRWNKQTFGFHVNTL